MSNFGLLGFPKTESFSEVKSILSAGIAQVLSGESVRKNDLLQMEAIHGKAYRVRNTDNAAVPTVTYGTAQTNAATGQIVAQTTVVAATTGAYARQAVLQGSDGSIYTFTSNDSSNNGLVLNRYSSAGALIGSVVISGASNPFSNNHILQLSNGNIAVLASNTSGYLLVFAIYDKDLNQVKATTTIEAMANSAWYFSACSLSAGGFAVVYQQNTNPLLSRLATFDNTGTAVLAPTTIWTRTGTTGYQYHKMVQLSSGDLAIAVSSLNTVSSIGLYHGVVTTAGVSVSAFANIDTTSFGIYPELSAFGGYYCVARENGTNMLASVFNNAGVLQGSGFSVATSAPSNGNMKKLLNDGTAFWLIWGRSSDSKEVITKLPVTGTNYATTVITTTTTQYGFYVDAFYENGCIVGVSQANSGALAPTVWVVNTSTGLLVNSAGTTFGSNAATACGLYHRVISGGDGAFICLYDYQGTGATNLCVGKYVNTAILSVANAAAAANTLATMAAGTGIYPVNTISGSPSKAFDMSATSQLYGNKGTLLNNAVFLKGM